MCDWMSNWAPITRVITTCSRSRAANYGATALAGQSVAVASPVERAERRVGTRKGPVASEGREPRHGAVRNTMARSPGSAKSGRCDHQEVDHETAQAEIAETNPARRLGGRSIAAIACR